MNLIRIKICGITCLEDAEAAAEAGADALGFVFAPSPRQVQPAAAAAIIGALPPFITTVGLLVDQDPRPILEACPLDVVQFHGSEPPEVLAGLGRRCYKALRIRDESDVDRAEAYRCASALMLDAYVPGVPGGTGQRFPWQLAVSAQRFGRPIVVAGGLTPENVGQCISVTRPYGVDVSSSVERGPGRKDAKLMRAFVNAVKDAAAKSCA
jgi:phosphoribosylanthranilate isomerase